MVTDLQRQIYTAIYERNYELTRDLLTMNPSEINRRGAGLTWLDRAASTGQGDIEMVELLIELGADVDPEGAKRTPLAYAIPCATIEVIRALMQHGANPNAARCIIGALNREEDVLAAVKLLVEHGVDVNRVFDLEGTSQKFTALDWAHDAKIIAYLRSVGAKTSAELLGNRNDDLDELAEVVQFFGNTFGKVDKKSLNQIVPSGHPITVHVIRASGKQKHLTLFTTGLSSAKMNVPDGFEKFALAELFIQLPGNWKFKSSDPRWSWPLKWLRRIAKYPHDNNVSLGGPVTIIANNVPPEPLGPNTKLTSLMLFAEKSFQRSDGEIVHLFRISPIHSDERELEMKKGAAALMRAFDRNNVPFVVDLQRPSVVTGV